jgi:hypothetical protein
MARRDYAAAILIASALERNVNEVDGARLERLLVEMRDNQKEALALQREQLRLAQQQFARAERINDRAEQIQAKSAQIIGIARRSLAVVLPIVVVLIAYLSWLMLRQ